MKKELLEALTLDSTQEHLVSLFGDEFIDDYYLWISENYNTIDLTGYDDFENTLGLAEDTFSMFLCDTKSYNDYLENWGSAYDDDLNII